jgi:hypothetical protein
VLDAEGEDLDGEGEVGTEAGAELGIVVIDDEIGGGHLDNRLAEEGAAAALHEVEGGVDGVGAVDGDVQLGVGVEGGERNAEGLGLLLGADGGGDGDDVLG